MKKERKNIVCVRLTDEEYVNLQMKAKASNKKVSEYIRELIAMSKVKVSNKDYVKMMAEVNKIGNNLNQIARNLNIACKKDELSKQDYEMLLAQLYSIDKQLKEILNECK